MKTGSYSLANGPRLIFGAAFVMAACGVLPAGGCGALNPAFVEILDSSGTGQLTTLENPPGHVVIQFINNAEIDERLIAFLESPAGGNLALTNADKRSLRPRVRIRTRVTFSTGVTQTFEFVDGSANFIDQRFSAEAFPDLNQNDLDNVVVLCDVTRVELMPGSLIEVFMPTELRVYELVETTTAGGAVTTSFQLREQVPPQFRTLQMDQLDQDGNVTLRANIGVRDLPAPAETPLCGSVIAIALNGVLSVPFLSGVDDAPSYDRDDQQTVASIGGRFEFSVSIN